MPIPQLNQNIKKRQSWRKTKKKYYLNYSRNRSRRGHGRRKTAGSFKSGFKNEKFGWLHNLRKKILLSSLILSGLGALLAAGTIFWLSRNLPSPDGLIKREIAQSTKIFDRTGETVLYEIHGNEKRTLINLDKIPDYLKWATIAVEDKDFYKHGGISLWGIFRGVVWQKIRGKRIQGGSTLTQQFVKNAILTSERTIRRKIKEWILAYKIEKKYSKDEILQMYLNEIPYGSTAYGVEAASRQYFGKSVQDINLPEAAILAALPQAPSRYSPYGSNINLLMARQHYILDLMREQGYISEAKAAAAKQYKLKFKKLSENIIAPHFVMYVKEILSEKYGEKTVEQGGLKIYTTLDLYKQKIAEEVIGEIGPKNEKNYQASNSALVSLDPKTGQILAMVGSRDYFDDDIDGQVNITTSARQPGSSLKPLVYAAAFLRGYTPNTILYDVVTNFSNDDNEPYEPHNYDDREHGPITMKKALAGSLNIPAVKTIYLAGIDNVLNLAKDFGYTTLNDRSRFGLSLVLGGGEVKLIEHTNAYSVFAREGIVHPLAAILKVEDKNGKILEEFKQQKKRVLEPQIARLINDILSDNEARAYAFGEKNWLTIGKRPVAAKTGTTNDYRDAWTIGYTPSIVTGVWVGNNNNSEMKRGAAGGTVAAPIWHDYMKRVLGDTPVESFKAPDIPKTGKPVLDGEINIGTIVKIDKASGLLATEYTPKNFIEEKTLIEPHCILYYIDRNNPLGDPPENPDKDPQFNLWESRVLKWAEKQWSSTSSVAATSTVFFSDPPPTEHDNLHLPENRPRVEVVSPGNNQAILKPILTARITATAPRGVKRAEYYIDDNLIAVNNSYPFNLEKKIDFLSNGFHKLEIKVCDDVDNCTIRKIEFNLILEETKETKKLVVSFLEPSSGLAVSNIDFPLPVKLRVNYPDLAAKVNFYFLSDHADKPSLFASIQPVESNDVAAFWNKIPSSNTYKIYGEVIGWNKQTIKSKEITVIVNNVSTD